MTIRTRLTLWYSLLLATVIFIFGISLFSLLNWAWYSQLTENMASFARQVQRTIRTDEATGSIETGRLPDTLAKTAFFTYAVQIWRHDGLLVARTDNLSDYASAFDPQSVHSTEPVTRDLRLTQSDGSEMHVLVSTVPLLAADGRRVGTLQILSPLTTLDAATERLLRVMLGVGVVALVLSFMFGSVIAAQALQPIDNIAQTARQITAADDLGRRIAYDGPLDELGQLTVTFNTTLERLERLFVAQRRFVADVSHELRTPLTAIRGNIELLQRYGNDPRFKEDLPRLAEATQSEVQRMTRLVNDLLMLAQADAGGLELIEDHVDIDTLVLEVFRQAQVLANGVQVVRGTIQPVRVRGDADRLKQLLLNLITNAIKYTPNGGRVTLSAVREGNFAVLRVSDTGIGIPKEDLPFIFDRFYRVDKARDRKMGGAGLGLSIVRWIAEAHEGRVWAESEIGQGTTFTIQIPVLETEPPESLRETRPGQPSLAAITGWRRISKGGPQTPAASGIDKSRHLPGD